jgi:hypothetical protein
VLVLVVQCAMPAQSRRRSPQSVNPIGPVTPTADFKGTLKVVDKKEILITTETEQVLTFQRTKKTKFFVGKKEVKPEELAIGEPVTVEGFKDNVGDMKAENVIQESASKRQ